MALLEICIQTEGVIFRKAPRIQIWIQDEYNNNVCGKAETYMQEVYMIAWLHEQAHMFEPRIDQRMETSKLIDELE